ncbi:MAG: hypothetical protein GY855_11305 [candidate division Zixibacteria bacterium]|nr:hypothetical protein [candidate division Zixibacteria bacterium]
MDIATNTASYTELFVKYGPYFLTLLFIMIGFESLRRSKKAIPENKKVYRLFSYIFIFSGILVSAVSIVWWTTHQTAIYVYHGEIKGLQDYEEIVSNDLYLKRIEISAPSDTSARIHDVHFIIVQNSPFTEDDIYNLYYYKQSGKPKELPLKYAPDPKLRFKIKWDTENDQYILDRLAVNIQPSSFIFNTAYAQEEIQYEQKIQKAPMRKYRRPEYERENIISFLQDETTDVGRKIETLDVLLGFDDDAFREIVNSSTSKESMIITLLDLSRHTDMELAYKADKAINGRFNVNDYLLNELISGSSAKIRKARTTLFRMEPQRAREILEKATSQSNNTLLNSIKEGAQSDTNFKVLRPTGSYEGDQYYVKCQWDPNNQEMFDCLTALFNRELINERNLEEEAMVMKARKNNDRYVYWKNKEWALMIAKKIGECGGTASFVAFYPEADK